METFGQEILPLPMFPDKEVQDLRVELIREELDELIEAITLGDLTEVADALTDILYVTYGAGHAFGIPLDECFAEVQRSNMSKLGEDGKPMYREDGKVMKGPQYSVPNLLPILYKINK
jgi:NTP pyrophosphatase (non-canonical NTP hydrolase)